MATGVNPERKICAPGIHTWAGFQQTGSLAVPCNCTHLKVVLSLSCHWNMVGVAKIVGEGIARPIPHINPLLAQASASSIKSSGDRIKRRGQVKDVTGSS